MLSYLSFLFFGTLHSDEYIFPFLLCLLLLFSAICEASSGSQDAMKIMASGLITSWQIDGETMETVTDVTFLGSKFTAYGDCSREVKRRLLLGRKAMMNLDSIFKSRDINLLTKPHIIKYMAFPVVMYACETWIIKKPECQRIDAFELSCWRLEKPLDCKEIKPINPKGNQSWIFIGKTDAEVEAPVLWPPGVKRRPWCWERLKAGRWRGQQRGIWFDTISDSMDMSLGKL